MNPVASPADSAAVPLSPEMLRALAGLHDLQLASGGDPMPWPWPIVALALAGAALWAWLRWRRPGRRRLRRLRQAERSYRASRGRSPGAGPELVAAIAALLREAATHPRRSPPMPAGLAGDDWLRWLDEQAPRADHGVFASGVGRELLHWPYVQRDRPATPPNFDPARAEALLALAARWLRARA